MQPRVAAIACKILSCTLCHQLDPDTLKGGYFREGSVDAHPGPVLYLHYDVITETDQFREVYRVRKPQAIPIARTVEIAA